MPISTNIVHEYRTPMAGTKYRTCNFKVQITGRLSYRGIRPPYEVPLYITNLLKSCVFLGYKIANLKYVLNILVGDRRAEIK